MDNQDKNKVLTLLFYLFIRQMGGLADCFRHILKDGLFITGELQGWRGFVQSELADLLALVRKTCDLFELDYKETEIMGQKRDAEKSQEYLKRHPGGFWV